MPTKRSADETPSGVPPASKLRRSNVEQKTPSPEPAAANAVASMADDAVMTAAKEAVVQASTYANKLSNIIESLIQKVEVAKLNSLGTMILHAEEVRELRDQNVFLRQQLSDSLASQQEAEERSSTHLVKLASGDEQFKRMQAKVAQLEEEAKAFGSRAGFETKLKQLKSDQSKKVQELKSEGAAQLQGCDAVWKRKISDVQAKHKEALSAKEEERKKQVGDVRQAYKGEIGNLKARANSGLKEREKKWKEVQKAKEVVSKNEISELRADHKEQLAKLRANVKMVEAAQRVVELNAERAEGGKGQVKVE
ncbi:hypothetical protein LTR85_000145 [Meristemomyces frigidus]|nr:hypothetical protein LTR85_000145 [Meristemomyces frigidus]